MRDKSDGCSEAKNMRNKYDVVVGDIGAVHSGEDFMDAMATYGEYVVQSRDGIGRAAGQSVCLIENSRIIREHIGTAVDDPEDEVEIDPMAGLKGLTTAISKVVEYNWEKEKDDFRDNEESRPLHIFRYLVHLDNFLEGTTATPESYL